MRVHISVVSSFFVSDEWLFWLVRKICWTKQHWCIECWGLYLMRYIFFTYSRFHSRWKRSLKTTIFDGKTCLEDFGEVSSILCFFLCRRDMLMWWPVCWRILLKKFEVIMGLFGWNCQNKFAGKMSKHHDTSLCGTSGNIVREIIPKRPIIVISELWRLF